MTGQNDRQDRSLTGQVRDQAGHCPLTGRYYRLHFCRTNIKQFSVQYLGPKILNSLLLSTAFANFKNGLRDFCSLTFELTEVYCILHSLGPKLLQSINKSWEELLILYKQFWLSEVSSPLTVLTFLYYLFMKVFLFNSNCIVIQD